LQASLRTNQISSLTALAAGATTNGHHSTVVVGSAFYSHDPLLHASQLF
jgi:hypothetical protein